MCSHTGPLAHGASSFSVLGATRCKCSLTPCLMPKVVKHLPPPSAVVQRSATVSNTVARNPPWRDTSPKRRLAHGAPRPRPSTRCLRVQAGQTPALVPEGPTQRGNERTTSESVDERVGRSAMFMRFRHKAGGGRCSSSSQADTPAEGKMAMDGLPGMIIHG